MSSFARRVRRNRMADERDAITLAARARGCRCDFETRHRRDGGISRVAVLHDDDCPAADSGSQLLLAPGRHQSPEEFGRLVVELIRELSR